MQDQSGGGFVMMIKKGTVSDHEHLNDFASKSGSHVVGINVGDSS